MTDHPQTDLSSTAPAQFPLNQLYFYLTQGCNLSCKHCWLSPKVQTQSHAYPTLPLDLFRSIIIEAIPLGLNVVKLTGGEPLMHPHIHELLDVVWEFQLGLVIETNGVLCTSALAAKIAAFDSPTISISLDGADVVTHEDIRGVPGCFEQALTGIRNLVEVGIKPQIIFTLMQNNKSQIEDIVRLAESLGVNSVKFNIVQPTGRGENLSKKGETLSVEELIGINQWISEIIAPNAKIKLFFDIPAAFRPMSKMFGPGGSGCSSCSILQILGVLADGSYALCGIGSHMPELVFGHAKKDKLEMIWQNNPVLLELREGLPSRFEGICGRCHLKRVCRASCIAQNYYSTHSLWKPFWFCNEAVEKGLFPTTRQIQ